VKYQAPKGTHDILPAEVAEWRRLEQTFREVCDQYVFEELRTPMFEHTEVFVRAVGEETDIVSKEMYVFEDRGGRSLALRPEGTAGVVRACLQHGLGGRDGKTLVKVYYLMPIFRYERPQAGRYRQHHQAGVEVLGSQDPALDAEVIDLACTYYARLDLTGVRVLINSVGCPACRPRYREELRAFLAPVLDRLCVDCRRRQETNPLRVLDCKHETCRELTKDAPLMLDHLCDECAAHFEQLRQHLKTLGVPAEVDPRIVRGLDYYTKTAFEVRHAALGAQDALMGGGRYDGLVEELGGPPTPAVGFGLGLERAILARRQAGAADTLEPRRGVFVAALGQQAQNAAVGLLGRLRRAGVRADMHHGDRGLRAQLRQADKRNYARAVLLGEDELRSGAATVRDLVTGEQVEIPLDELAIKLAEQ